MFEGEAQDAMSFYVSLFEDAQILEMDLYDENGPGEMGTVHRARFELLGREYICIDSPIRHDFGFTPSLSLFAEFDEEDEIEAAYLALSEEGNILMPYQEYPFAERYCWLQDRFGVAWQLSWVGHAHDDDPNGGAHAGVT